MIAEQGVSLVPPPQKRLTYALFQIFPRLFEAVQVAGWLYRDRRYFRGQEDLLERLEAAIDGPTHIEIETLNRCNNGCSFCPVNRAEDPRTLVRMERRLFERIVADLAERDYRHKLCLHSNNEPLLDRRIFDFATHARRALPHAYIQMYTNGTVLDEVKAERLLEQLSSLVVNNYGDRVELPERIERVVHHIERRRPELARRLSVRYRLLDEFKSNRSSRAPNRRLAATYRSRCAYPFFQMVVRPDGRVSMCCYDATGEVTLGNVARDGIWGAWRDLRRLSARRAMLESRARLDKCSRCDNLGWAKPARLAAALASPDLSATYQR